MPVQRHACRVGTFLGGIDGLAFEVRKVDRMPDDSSPAMWFEKIFDEAPVFLPDIQETAERGALGARWERKTLEGIVMTIEWDHTVGCVNTQSARAVAYMAVGETTRDGAQR